MAKKARLESINAAVEVLRREADATKRNDPAARRTMDNAANELALRAWEITGRIKPRS